MEINARNDLKLVEIWVTNDEQQSEGFEKSLKKSAKKTKPQGVKPLCSAQAAKIYMTVRKV